MPFVLIRQIYPLPGREAEAIAWYKDTEPLRRRAGQRFQTLLHGVVDRAEYRLIQEWSSQDAYEAWKRSPDRERLQTERSRLMIHEPATLYETL